MVDISKETCEKYWVELIVDRVEILWLHKKQIEEGLDHENLHATTLKYLSN